jgi:hypothetical protein
METRSGALHRISRQIHELRETHSYLGNTFGSVAELRAEFPGLVDRELRRIEQLIELAEELERDGRSALDIWAATPEKPRRDWSATTPHKSTLPRAELVAMRGRGDTLRAIGAVAGISAERVRQILNRPESGD